MKNRVFKAFLLLALVGTLFTACKKEYPQPPIQDLPIGTVFTIDSILTLESGHFFDTAHPASVYGIVTADEQSGNLYKMAFMQDRATGAAIELRLTAPSGVRIGDSIRVYLPGVTYTVYNGLPQLDGFSPDGHIVILANNKPIEPARTTISEIKTGRYLAGLVRLENVWFTEQTTFAQLNDYGNRYLVDAENPTGSDRFVVRTSSYANFANNPLPTDTGNLVAIASLYRDTWQLIIRSASELEFNNYDPTGGQNADPGEVQSLPYKQSFGSGFGTYMSYSVKGDDQFWKLESLYNAVVMTGHIQEGDQHFYYANEDWLVSSPVSLEGIEQAKMTLTYIGRYFNNINNDVTVWASTDYEYGTNPAMATWTQVPANLVTSSSWSDTKTAELSLSQFVGQTVTFAVKYISSDSNAGTMEVMSIFIEEGQAGDNPPPGPTPVDGEGTGTADDPYNVAAGIGLQNDEPTAWVHGYIVGAVKSGLTSVSSNADINWNGPFDLATNVIIADDAACREISQCIIVNLPAGKPLRAQVNLMDNSGNLGKHLAVNGKLRKYFNQAGLRDSNGSENDFVLEGGGVTPPVGNVYLNETLLNQSSFDKFSSYSVAGDQVWGFDSRYGAVMSGYADNTSFANEDWFVTPVVDLSASTNPILTFEHARGPESSMNVGVAEGYYSAWVTNGYTDGSDPTQTTWVELPILNHPTVKWQYVNSGELVIPAEYRTATCRIAFRYLSIDGASATWEIKNVVVKEQ